MKCSDKSWIIGYWVGILVLHLLLFVFSLGALPPAFVLWSLVAFAVVRKTRRWLEEVGGNFTFSSMRVSLVVWLLLFVSSLLLWLYVLLNPSFVSSPFEEGSIFGKVWLLYFICLALFPILFTSLTLCRLAKVSTNQANT